MIKKIANKIQMAALVAPVYAAQEQIKLAPETNSTWNKLTALTAGSIISGAISLALVVVALVFFFMLILGGFKWITSEGDEKSVGAARGQITNALIGLAVVFAAWAIVKLIETVFGISIISGLTIPSFQPGN